MPRQIDLFAQNLQVGNNPNSQLAMSSTQVTNFTTQLPALIEQAMITAINEILTEIDDLTGLNLLQWAQLLEGNSGVTGSSGSGLLAQFMSWLSTVSTDASNAWTQFENFFTTGDWSDLSTAWNDLTQGIFGSATSPGILGSIPSTAVSSTTQNLQPVFDFPDAQSVAAAGQWSWDGTVDHTGTSGSGSAKCVANGELNQLLGIPGAVQPGQVVTPQGFVSWSGLTASGSPIQLQLIPWSGTSEPGTAGSPVTPSGCSITSPGTSSTTYTGESSGWVELTGSYTVPSSGVGFVQLCLVVGASATTGTVHFDDCANDVTGGFLANLQNDLTDIIASFAPGGTPAEFQTGVTNLLALFGLTSSNVGSATSVNTAWTSIINDILNPLNAIETQASNIIGDIEQSAVSGLTQVWDWLTGTTTPTSTTQVQATAVSNVLGGASLGADVTTVHTTATDGSSWVTRLVNDTTILLDVFHLTYTSTQWNNAWSDLMTLLGIVNSTSTPTNPTPTIGTAITTAQSTATSASSAASAAQSTLNTTNTNLFGSTTPSSAIQSSALPTVSIGGVSNTIEGHLQAIVDANANALGVSTTTGNPISAITTGLSAIPAANVVGNTGATVTFGAKGAGGYTAPGTSSASTSWTHTIATGDLGVLVFISYLTQAATITSSVTFGGTAMTMLQRTAATADPNGWTAYIEAWWLKSPASSTQTVAVSVSRSGSGTIQALGGDSASYVASKVNATDYAEGSGSTSLSQSMSSTTGNMVVGGFGVACASAMTLTSFTQTSRYNQVGSGTGNGWGMAFGDAAGASSVSFGLTSSQTAYWAGITVELTN
jgi:hypothetical protein